MFMILVLIIFFPISLIALSIVIGSICNCILPESLKISAVRHDPDGQSYNNGRKRLRSAFSFLSSISMRQKQLSTSSMFLQSPLKGCLPWELRRSINGSFKERWKNVWRVSWGQWLKWWFLYLMIVLLVWCENDWDANQVLLMQWRSLPDEASALIWVLKSCAGYYY